MVIEDRTWLKLFVFRSNVFGFFGRLLALLTMTTRQGPPLCRLCSTQYTRLESADMFEKWSADEGIEWCHNKAFEHDHRVRNGAARMHTRTSAGARCPSTQTNDCFSFAVCFFWYENPNVAPPRSTLLLNDWDAGFNCEKALMRCLNRAKAKMKHLPCWY